MSIARLARALRSAHDDRGVALPTVLIFMLAGVILTMVVASTVLYSYTFSSSTRAGVQAQASAQAGIAAARAGLINGTCSATGGLYTGTDPVYSVQIYKPSGAGGWSPGCPAISEQARIVATGTAATKGVQGDSSGDTAKVETVLGGTGSPLTLTASGPAIFAYSASGAGAGGNLVSLDGTNVDVMLRTGTVTCDGGFQGAANVVVKSGTFNAVAGCNLAGNVWVNGDINISGGAYIGGSVTGTNITISNGTVGGNMWADAVLNGTNGTIAGWVSADVLKLSGSKVVDAWSRSTTTPATMTSGTVAGVLTAASSITLTGGTVASIVAAGSVTTSISVPGGIHAGGDVTVNNGTTTGVITQGTLVINKGNVKGTVHGGGFTMGGGWLTFTGGQFSGPGCINTNGDVSGPVKVSAYTVGGACKAKNDPSWWWSGHGPFTQGPVGAPPAPVLAISPSKPAAITVPNWIDFGSKPEHYTGAGWPGFTAVALGSTCTAAEIYGALQTIGTSPGVIDARNCTNGIQLTSSGTEYTGGPDISRNGFTFKNDLVIIANVFNLAGSARFTGAGAESELWLINPDVVGNGTPDCAPGEKLAISGGFTFQKLRTLIYSPCEITIGSSTSLKGQIFAGETQIAGGATVTYAPVGLPGYDLNTGDETAVVATEWDRPIVSQRNITG